MSIETTSSTYITERGTIITTLMETHHGAPWTQLRRVRGAEEIGGTFIIECDCHDYHTTKNLDENSILAAQDYFENHVAYHKAHPHHC